MGKVPRRTVLSVIFDFRDDFSLWMISVSGEHFVESEKLENENEIMKKMPEVRNLRICHDYENRALLKILASVYSGCQNYCLVWATF